MNRFKKINKILLIFFGFLAFGLILPLNASQAKVQPYYSGDAVSYQGEIIVGSTNTGYLEIFKLSENKKLERLVKVKSYDPITNAYAEFSDLRFSLENDHLYVYATSGYTVFKYDLSDTVNLSLIAKVKNTFWSWYHRVDSYGSDLGLVSDKGVQIINNNLEAVDSFSFSPLEKYSLRSNSSDRYLFGISEDKLQVYDRINRAVSKEIPLEFKDSNSNHKIYFDSINNTIYAVDDYYAKKIALDGRVLSSFRHLEAPGYDVESSVDNPFIYFSNGQGVVKLHKDTFKMADYAFTTSLVAPQGWAMGLKLLNTDNGDRLVVFNASNIVILDANLNKIGSVLASQEEDYQSVENLFLELDHNLGAAGARINLSGGGFWSNENLKISFGTQTTNIFADFKGRLNTHLTVPNLSPQRLDIKVSGTSSGLSYSTSFEIK